MYDVLAIVSIFLIFAALAACVELGVRAGHRRAAMHGAGAHAGLGAVEGAVFGLLGLLLALTFSAAATRFDLRRELIVREAEAIEAAYRRLDLLPEATQPELRALFGRYLDARLAFYSRPSEFQNPVAELERIDVLEGEIWTRAIAACRTAESHEVKLLVLPALNEMYKIAATRLMALRMHTPGLVFAVLIALSLICAMIGGYALSGGKGHRWMHLIGSHARGHDLRHSRLRVPAHGADPSRFLRQHPDRAAAHDAVSAPDDLPLRRFGAASIVVTSS